MKNNTYLYCALLIFICYTNSFGQKKNVNASKIKETISIDGKLDEASWLTADVATDFFMLEPDNGTPINQSKKTDIKILYTNKAIYIGAILRDDKPNLINKEITQRDNFGISDHFGVFINGFNDGQQDFRFFVSASGVQMDCAATENKEDFSWDAIWDSHVTITDEGWVVEMEIPYAALRFSNQKEQTWGINFIREIKRARQKYTWTNIDNKIGSFINQNGNLSGIKDIKTPTRLFFIPYSSFYAKSNQDGTESFVKGGMDLKYGINDSYTLDAILVPDFGQAAFDNLVLNLGPFEQQLDENRPFFTEGTDLFNKGKLLYSRRIGGSPSTYPTTDSNEKVLDYPSRVNLLNALKLSGRSKNGLGIGVLNAITEKAFASVLNTDTNIVTDVEVEPLTNYNVMVLDKRFNTNSSVSLINTNVTRNGHYRDANVTGLIFDLNTKKNTYTVSGDIKLSSINEGSRNSNGFSTLLNIGKTFGRHRYSISSGYISKEYNINDLGINFERNFHSIEGNYNFRTLTSTKNFNFIRFNTNLITELENTTGKLQEARITGGINGFTKSNLFMMFAFGLSPVETYNFYEARKAGRTIIQPRNIGNRITFSTDYNKAFALDLETGFRFTSQENRSHYSITVSPRYRINDKASVIYRFNVFNQNSDIGYVDNVNTEIILAERNRSTYTNTITGKYSLNNKMTINLVARHYWSYAENFNFYNLQEDGTFLDNKNTTYNKNKDINLNLWNFDVSYSWWFAPGSQLTVLYRNNAADSVSFIEKDLSANLNNLFQNNLNHTFSLNLRYFIDYNDAKGWFSKA
jgi:hypothetical protein